MLVANIGNGRDIWYAVFRVRNRLDVYTACFGIDGLIDVVGIVANNPLHVDLEFPHVHAELVECPAVEPAGANEVVSWKTAICECHELGLLVRSLKSITMEANLSSMSGGCRYCPNTAF